MGESAEQRDRKAQLAESFKSTSTGVAAIGLLVLALSIYLLQRSVLAMLGDVNATSGQRQDNYDGLDFTFASVSLVGPLVLAFACLVLTSLSDARRRAWSGYLEVGGHAEFFPWALAGAVDPHHGRFRAWLRGLSLLPLAAVVAHALAGVRIVQMGAAEWLQTHGQEQVQQQANGALVPEPAVWVPVGVLMVIVCVLASRSVLAFRGIATSISLTLPLPSAGAHDDSG